MNVATGGPAGDGDAYLQITSVSGNGPGTRLVVFNSTQWAGDYMAAGITAISMDVDNLGATDLELRLSIATQTSAAPTDRAVSSVAIPLLAGSGWTTVQFPIDPGDLTALAGSVANALAGAS